MSDYAVARTKDEVLLYLELNPCPDCGTTATPWQDGLAHEDDELVISYSTDCAGCGAERVYLFGLPERETAESFPCFGGAEPSELIDPGQWLLIADGAAGAASQEPEAAGPMLRLARLAVEEALKFVPPGAAAVPGDAFWSDEGRAVRDAEPGRFQLERLLVVRDSFANQGDA